MSVIYATNAKLSIKSGDGEWKEVGDASLVEIEMTLDDIAPYLFMPRHFEIECTVTWFNRWAFALPPIGCMPMCN